MADFKLAGIVSAVGLGLGYLLGGRSSQVRGAESNDIQWIASLEFHDDSENKHKYYAHVRRGLDDYVVYGRLPGYGRASTVAIKKQRPSDAARKIYEKINDGYDSFGIEGSEIGETILKKFEDKFPPKSEPKQPSEPKKALNPLGVRMAMRRRQEMGAEYQPDQEIGDYSISEIAKSSAIEGYQPNKYSFGPIGYGAESVSDLKLKKESCCCGATKSKPCLCMIQGEMNCSAKAPMCPCYAEIEMGTDVEMEHTKSRKEARKIAMEHLAEHPDYYSRLKKAGLNAETFEADMSVGNEMLRQLGGRRFMMMVGAKQPIWDGDKNELGMKIGRNALGANYFTIRLNPRDLYDLRFESRRMNRKTYEMSVNVKAEFDDVYADQLQEIFERTTGLYVRMAESSDSVPKPNPKVREETYEWIFKEHPHIKTDADREMEGIDYAALTYHPEELEAGAINALKAGDFDAAENFVKALNRQKFIKAFQAERNW